MAPFAICHKSRRTNDGAMPRLFEGTSTKRRPGLGLGGSGGLATGSSTASASVGLTLEPANVGGNSNSNSGNSRNRQQQQQAQRRTAMDLIDTDSSSSEDDDCGGSIDSSFDFDVPEEEKRDQQQRRVKGKENNEGTRSTSSSGARPKSKSKSRQPKKIVVSDKAKTSSKTSSKKSAASSSSVPTKKKRGATAATKKSATAATASSKKKNSSSSSDGGGVKAKANNKSTSTSATSASKATKSIKKRSPTRVRFEEDAASNENHNAQGPNFTTAVPSITTTGSAQRIPSTIPIPPRAVAVDTRTVQSFEGDAAGTAFLRRTLSFLKSCARRGMLPPILAVTTNPSGGGGGGAGTKKSKRSTTIGTKVVHLPTDRLTGREYAIENGSAFGAGGGTTSGMTGAMGAESLLPPEAQEEQMYWRDILLEGAVPIRCASALVSMDGGHAGNVPKPLLAHDSWKYFADSVKSVDGQIQRDNAGATAGSNFQRPRTLTIFTNDVALFSDTAVDSHKRALGRFWDTIRGSFQNGSVGSIQIAIYETGAAALVQGRKRKGNNQAMDSEASSLEGDVFDDNNERGEDATEQETEEEVAATDEALAHRMRVKQCIALLQREIQSLQEKDRRRSATPISVELLVIESPIKFQTLLRDWISAIISPASGTEGGKISFNLPETLDGSQCALSLDLVPSLLPYRVDSPEAAELMTDLKALSLAELEVIQVVPISSVDGSLLHGVPMSATAAMDSDLFRYKDMKVLTRQLFRYMAMKDVAIALRCVGTRGLEGKGAKNAAADKVDEGQIFLLMAEHPAETIDQSLSSSSLSSSAAPSRGVLYRYATLDHIIHDHETVDALDNDSADEDMSEQYFEYVEQSLEMVDSKILNPILLPSTTIVKRKAGATSLDESLSSDVSDVDCEAGPTNKSSREADGDAPVAQHSPKSDQDDDFTTFFDDDDDEDLRFFENDFEY